MECLQACKRESISMAGLCWQFVSFDHQRKLRVRCLEDLPSSRLSCEASIYTRSVVAWNVLS